MRVGGLTVFCVIVNAIISVILGVYACGMKPRVVNDDDSGNTFDGNRRTSTWP